MAMDLQRLMSLLRQCMQRYDMVSAGDKIAVGLSGGKDSLTLLMGLKHLQRFYPVPYGLCAIHVGSGAPGSEADVETMRQFCEGLDVPFYLWMQRCTRLCLKSARRSTRAACAPSSDAARSTTRQWRWDAIKSRMRTIRTTSSKRA